MIQNNSLVGGVVLYEMLSGNLPFPDENQILSGNLVYDLPDKFFSEVRFYLNLNYLSLEFDILG